MKYPALLASTAVLALFLSAPANAQMQEKGGNEKGAPAQTQREQAPPKAAQPSAPEKQAQPQPQAQPPQKQAPQPDTQQKQAQPGAQTPSPKGKEAQKNAEPKAEGNKGAAQRTPDEKAGKGTAQRPDANKAPNAAQTGSKEHAKEAPKSAETDRPAGQDGKRVQLSEQQRTSVQDGFRKDTRINRAKNVNFTINVGGRLPREVRLVAVPAFVISMVPEYRSYRYVVIDDRICIVEPTSYEIVDVIDLPGQTAGGSGNRPVATLVLTDDERAVLLREIDLNSGSTLALGAFNEGAAVPRGAEVRAFPDVIVQRVPKVQGHRFFTAEGRLAIVDSDGQKVLLVIERR